MVKWQVYVLVSEWKVRQNSCNLSLCVCIGYDIVRTTWDDLWDKVNTLVLNKLRVCRQVGVLSWQQWPSGANVHPATCNRSHVPLSWLWSTTLSIFLFPRAMQYRTSRCRQYTQSLAATSCFFPLVRTYTIETVVYGIVYLNLSDPLSHTIF